MALNNNAHSEQIRKWINESWGLGRLFRRISYLYANIGPTILLKQILTIAEEERTFYSWRTISELMRKHNFEAEEKKAVFKWVTEQKTHSIYASKNTTKNTSKSITPLNPTANPLQKKKNPRTKESATVGGGE